MFPPLIVILSPVLFKSPFPVVFTSLLPSPSFRTWIRSLSKALYLLSPFHTFSPPSLTDIRLNLLWYIALSTRSKHWFFLHSSSLKASLAHHLKQYCSYLARNWTSPHQGPHTLTLLCLACFDLPWTISGWYYIHEFIFEKVTGLSRFN